MSFMITYQVADSSALQNPFGVEDQDDQNGLELIEEVDEPVVLPKQKKKYFSKVKLDTTEQADTFYGIKNEGEIPIRATTTATIEEKPLEKLFDPTLNPPGIANWQIIILVATVLLLGFSKAFSRSRFKQSLRALFNYGVAQEITREEKVLFHRSNILFTIIHVFTSSLFLYHIKESIDTTNLEENNMLFFLMLIGFLIFIYMVKYLFSKVLFFVLDDTSIASEYIFNVSLFNNLLGVIFIPVLCLAYFSTLPFSLILLYITIPLVLLTFLLRLIRLYLIGISKGVSYFYIFVYICTLEILPLVVLYRIFILK